VKEKVYEFNPGVCYSKLFGSHASACDKATIPVTKLTVRNDDNSTWLWAANDASFWFIARFPVGIVFIGAERALK